MIVFVFFSMLISFNEASFFNLIVLLLFILISFSFIDVFISYTHMLIAFLFLFQYVLNLYVFLLLVFTFNFFIFVQLLLNVNVDDALKSCLSVTYDEFLFYLNLILLFVSSIIVLIWTIIFAEE